MLYSYTEIINRMLKRTDSNHFVCVQKQDQWYSYEQIWSRAYYIAEKLMNYSTTKVIVIMNNGIDLFTMFFACMLSNITIIPIDPQKSNNEIQYIIDEHSECPIIREDDEIFVNINAGVDGKLLTSKIQGIDLEKEYMITYTSGSTGHAKGVIHSLRNLFWAGIAFGKATGLGEEYIMCHVMPMTYMAGILNTIIMPFILGSKIIILPRFDVISAISFWKNVQKYNINAFWLSPTMLNILLTVDKKGKIREYIKDKNTLFFVGTAPLFKSTRDCFEQRFGVKLLQSYGLSETLFISCERLDMVNDSKSVGTVLDDVSLTFFDDQEIGINVPWMFFGYSNENTQEYFWKNNYLSGDLGEIKNDRLYITGRKKDLIVKGGMNISPSQIENCIINAGVVKECAVAGVVIKDEENIVCWYVKNEGEDFSVIELNKNIEATLGHHCRIDYYKELKEIPKNLNGKIDKQKLVEEFKNDIKT